METLTTDQEGVSRGDAEIAEKTGNGEEILIEQTSSVGKTIGAVSSGIRDFKVGDKVTFTRVRQGRGSSISLRTVEGTVMVVNAGTVLTKNRRGRLEAILKSECRKLGERSALTEAFFGMNGGAK